MRFMDLQHMAPGESEWELRVVTNCPIIDTDGRTAMTAGAIKPH